MMLSSFNSRVRETIDELVSETLQRGEAVRVRVTTLSMSPLVQPGEGLVVEYAEVSSFALGEIVLFREGATWVAHRLVARAENGEWLTKGDRAPICDKIQAREWIGRIRAIETKRKRVELIHSRGWAKWIAWLSFRQAVATDSGKSGQARVYRIGLRLSTALLRARLVLQPVNLAE